MLADSFVWAGRNWTWDILWCLVVIRIGYLYWHYAIHVCIIYVVFLHRCQCSTIFSLNVRHSTYLSPARNLSKCILIADEFPVFLNSSHRSNNSPDRKGIPIFLHKRWPLVVPQSLFFVSCHFMSYTQKTTSKHIYLNPLISLLVVVISREN